jgi:hypothetical protein
VFRACHPERGRQPESKDPLPLPASIDSPGNSHLSLHPKNALQRIFPGKRTRGPSTAWRLASRSRHSAQDDSDEMG